MQKLVWSLVNLFKIIVVISILIYFTAKDYFYWSSIIFYAFPLPVIFGISVLLFLLKRKCRFKIMYFMISFFLGFFWIVNSYCFNDFEFIGESPEIVFWNAAKKRNFKEAFVVSESLPDVLVMVEYDQTDKENINTIKSKYKNYYFSIVRGKIGVFSKEKIENVRAIEMKHNSFMVYFNTRILGKDYNFYAVDITANIKYFRKPMLDEAYRNIKTTKNTIVLGDFNTPYESVHFKNYKTNFSHAFSEKGHGFRETWQWNLPLLSIDHIWVSRDITPQFVEKIKTFKSDHVMLKMIIK